MSQERRRGEVISFPPAANRPRRTVAPEAGVVGTVLFFTGVRYGRAGEGSPIVPPAGAADMAADVAGDRRIGG